MPSVMPAISANPTQVQAASSKTVATGKTEVGSFSSELTKATNVSHPFTGHAATGESPGHGTTSVRMDNRRAPAASEHSTSEHSTSNTPVTTDWQQSLVAKTTVAPITVPAAADKPLAASEQIAFEANLASSNYASSVSCSSQIQTADASGTGAPSTNSAGFLQSPSLGSQFPVTSSALLTDNLALGTSDCGTSPVELANSLQVGSGTGPSGTVPGALFSRTIESDCELENAIAKSGDTPGTSNGIQAAASSSLKAAVGTFPIHTTDGDISSEAGVHRQPKQGTDIAAESNRVSRVSQSLNDIMRNATTKIDSPKIDSPKIESTKADTARIDILKPDTRGDASTESDRESGKSSPESGDGKPDHGSKHEGNAAAGPAGLNLDSKGIQQSSVQSSFVNVIGTQTLGADIAKATVSSTVLADSELPVASMNSSRPANVDLPGQQAVEASPLPVLQSAVQAAKLVERAGQAELRVGFQAGELGNVDIRTSMAHNQVSAEISVEHSELRNLLAVELPHLQEKLSAHQVTATNIVLNNQSGGGSADSRQAYRQIAQTPQRPISGRAQSDALPGVMSIAESQIPSAQLDIHM